jgi:hypothetical protein
MPNLWTLNTPARFWQSGASRTDAQWDQAVQRALPVLGLPDEPRDVEELLALTLGEGRLGGERWRLGPAKQAYYMLKPLLPRALTRTMRRIYGRLEGWKAGRLEGAPQSSDRPIFQSSNLHWPADTRYAEFQWEVMRQLVSLSGEEALPFTHFWPDAPGVPGSAPGGLGYGSQYAFVLTHDVETAEGLAFARQVADLDESFGFRSSFNLVPERYPLDYELIDELRARGFEIGVHGLKHDGKLFRSRAEFERRAERINHYLREFDAVGFRAPLTHRHAEWMQALEIEYDLSFFDTDPYEPMPGGTMSLWPFMLGRFVELPYTLVQDYVLTAVLQETTPRLWLDKVDVIEKYHGMALLNSHPDYMMDGGGLAIYRDFLYEMKERGGFWHALPRDIARWWRARLSPGAAPQPPDTLRVEAWFGADGITIDWGEVKDVVPEVQGSAPEVQGSAPEVQERAERFPAALTVEERSRRLMGDLP